MSERMVTFWGVRGSVWVSFLGIYTLEEYMALGDWISTLARGCSTIPTSEARALHYETWRKQ